MQLFIILIKKYKPYIKINLKFNINICKLLINNKNKFKLILKIFYFNILFNLTKIF